MELLLDKKELIIKPTSDYDGFYHIPFDDLKGDNGSCALMKDGRKIGEITEFEV